MSASAAQIQRRRAKNALKAKTRKTKIRAVIVVSIFVLVLAIQGPRTLKMISGGDAAPAAAPASASAPERVQEKLSRALQSLRRTPGGDPFAAAVSDRESRPGAVAGPAGLRDPFGGQPAAATATPVAQIPRLVVGTPSRNSVAKRSFIVVLASIPTSRGRSTATRFARSARGAGIGSIAVLDSSKRNPLRPGYFVVYLGSFKTAGAATRAVALARREGFRGSYRRELIRY